MLTILTALVLAAQTPSAQAPAGVVAGVVEDVTRAPLAGVAVSIGGQTLKAPQTVHTTSDGHYRFGGITPGSYTLSYRLRGYLPVNETLVVQDVSAVVAKLPLAIAVVVMKPAGESTPIRFTTRSGTGSALSGLVPVRIETSFGSIDIVVDTNLAPITAANFLKYVDAGLYDGGRFNRATRPDNYNTAPPDRPMMELIQGGLSPDRRKQAFPPIPLERTTVTGIKHVRGVVSMARGEADTATSEFFILLDDQPSLDMGGRRFPDQQGAAAFGYVIAGLDVVTKIQQQPVEGQNLSPPVGILSVKRIQK
jgi:peptidyl-prolyl cis-trans isomerase A (cyclophilin A)